MTETSAPSTASRRFHTHVVGQGDDAVTYDVHGDLADATPDRPVLFMFASPMDAAAFGPMASLFTDRPVVTYDPIRDPLPVPGAAGRVVPQADLRVVDGEALVRGPALMLGYLDDLILIPLGAALARRMIPPVVLADCRIKAMEVMAECKPVNWIAAGVIIAIWLLLAALTAFWLVGVFFR